LQDLQPVERDLEEDEKEEKEEKENQVNTPIKMKEGRLAP
jgi:hypothetical protein